MAPQGRRGGWFSRVQSPQKKMTTHLGQSGAVGGPEKSAKK